MAYMSFIGNVETADNNDKKRAYIERAVESILDVLGDEITDYQQARRDALLTVLDRICSGMSVKFDFTENYMHCALYAAPSGKWGILRNEPVYGNWHEYQFVKLPVEQTGPAVVPLGTEVTLPSETK